MSSFGSSSTTLIGSGSPPRRRPISPPWVDEPPDWYSPTGDSDYYSTSADTSTSNINGPFPGSSETSMPPGGVHPVSADQPLDSAHGVGAVEHPLGRRFRPGASVFGEVSKLVRCPDLTGIIRVLLPAGTFIASHSAPRGSTATWCRQTARWSGRPPSNIRGSSLLKRFDRPREEQMDPDLSHAAAYVHSIGNPRLPGVPVYTVFQGEISGPDPEVVPPNIDNTVLTCSGEIIRRYSTASGIPTTATAAADDLEGLPAEQLARVPSARRVRHRSPAGIPASDATRGATAQFPSRRPGRAAHRRGSGAGTARSGSIRDAGPRLFGPRARPGAAPSRRRVRLSIPSPWGVDPRMFARARSRSQPLRDPDGVLGSESSDTPSLPSSGPQSCSSSGSISS
ncbi:uncharacterized protein JN550_009917 [Neoarthrinium moseri]|uniref:uncharacterized protein n=1 Tax=Neoarthrinium moseri TaxID=1658444 RepID=UPI001FDAE57E|nr:uncharacterized protein JN550_009917 [Neoarthrinium moseri]KAI1862770.1 hypothetical protein JN550_009917 [Neoarthrinium moseri]